MVAPILRELRCSRLLWARRPGVWQGQSRDWPLSQRRLELRVQRLRSRNHRHLVGTPPNFMKIAPLMERLEERGVAQSLVHTGQHYDRALSDAFFEDLGMPYPPDHFCLWDQAATRCRGRG